MTKFVCDEHPNAAYIRRENNDLVCGTCESMEDPTRRGKTFSTGPALQSEELPFGELMDPHFAPVTPSMEEAELLGTATMNLVNSGIELATILDPEGKELVQITETATDKLRAVIFWANQLRELMQIQVAKAGNGMQV